MKNLYCIFILVWILATAMSAFAQQLPLYSQFTRYGFVHNPAMTGWDEDLRAAAAYRHQWTSMPEAPRTATAGAQNYFEDYQMSGGAFLIHDQTGPTAMTGLQATYAYHLDFDSWYVERNRLTFGISAGVFQYRLRGDQLRLHDPDDLVAVDNALNRIVPHAGAGVFYNTDFFFGGVAVPQLLALSPRYRDETGNSFIPLVPHVYMHGGGRIPFGEENFIEPSIWVRYAPAGPLNIALNTRAQFNNLLQVGLGYSSDRTFTAEAGVRIADQYEAGYAFSFQFSPIQSYLGSTHELMLCYIIRPKERYAY